MYEWGCEMKWKTNNGVLINGDIQFIPQVKPRPKALDRAGSVDIRTVFSIWVVGIVYQMTIPEQLDGCLLA